MRTCEVDGCSKKHLARGMCAAHYSKNIYVPKAGTRGTLTERFWRKVAVAKGDECWSWNGSTSPAGYAQIWGGPAIGRPIAAHRVSYEIHHGPIPVDRLVMHSCDNPICCNPKHLSLGTDKANAADKVDKRRHSYGENRYNAKLTDDKVRQIRRETNSTLREMSNIYGVSESVLVNIRKGRTWRHVS